MGERPPRHFDAAAPSRLSLCDTALTRKGDWVAGWSGLRGRMTIIDRIAAFHKDQSITKILSIVIWSHIHSCRQGGAGTMCHHLFIPLLEESRVAHDQTETRPRSRRSIEARPRPVRPSVGQLRARGRGRPQPGSRIYGEPVAERYIHT